MVNQQSLSLSGSGIHLANVVVNSDLLHNSWGVISALYAEVNAQQQLPSSTVSVRCKRDDQSCCTVIGFVTWPICTQVHFREAADLVSSATLKQNNFLHFESLLSKGNPSFSIHRAAITLFQSHFYDFLNLKNQLLDPNTNELLVKTPLIIAGHSLGGSLAALFTLWLLDSINPKTKRPPFCVTFGSPFIGDKGLQRAVSERSRWSSCFLHVAGNQDPLPSLFSLTGLYMPFGTFLFCSEMGCACVEDPESVLLMTKDLESTRSQVSNEELPVDYYGRMVESMRYMFLLKRNSQLGLSITNPSQEGLWITLQLEAVGIEMTQQRPSRGEEFSKLVKELGNREIKWKYNAMKAISPNRKLNEVKLKMAFLEWYKKESKLKGIGYYDSYKHKLSSSDMDVTKHKKFLTNYWKDMVEEAERKPQKETAFIRSAWLYAGTNYRRMIEPLDIAEYYRVEGKRDYRNQGRSRHYVLLEQWQKEGERSGGNTASKRKNVAGILTEDSCFWADVEEAIISCKIMNDATTFAERQANFENLRKFEESVMNQIHDSALSPEIFLDRSSFMTWWKEFLKITEQLVYHLPQSPLMEFMKNRKYEKYSKGENTD